MRQVPVAEILDANQVLAALFAFKKGDFSVRLPVNQVGLAGKIADVLNDIFELNENMATELARVSTAVGKEGRISQRASLGPTRIHRLELWRWRSPYRNGQRLGVRLCSDPYQVNPHRVAGSALMVSTSERESIGFLSKTVVCGGRGSPIAWRKLTWS